ncbi:MAG: iron-containing alcohol dehydrogenase [Sphaerochaetaceae bacterium]|jgi:alcohol dehydrogenase YqhD (iron-dependent ADH family)|nr:iron-containing alcohol dehydrogenase [Sphaerochaetaceae bacterium]MDD4219324.1 iron-containing alcohol dehydrogenase [Sphaerochaetaceae bacterium]
MIDFSFCIPTCIILGKESLARVGSEIAQRGGNRVLIVHDGGSYLEDLLKTVHKSITDEGLTVLEMEEKATQPCFSLIHKGVEFCHANQVDFILAVGGGTVMDTAKGMAFLAVNGGNLTDYVLNRKESSKCMPVASVVTLSGTGSEISGTAMVIDDLHEPAIKYPLFQESIRFLFSIIDPSLTCTLPMRTTLAGAFDAITHVIERYFNGSSGYDLQGRMCESVMSSIMYNMRQVIKNPADYDTRAQLQLGATLANSTLLELGCESDWAVHYMENPITTETHELHGATLAVIAPAWMRYCYKRDLPKAVDFAVRVMGVSAQESDQKTALAGIDAFQAFLEEVGLPTHLSQLGIESDRFEEMARRAVATAGKEYVGEISRLNVDEVTAIYEIAK